MISVRPTLLVGAGAVENAWEPVARAIQPYCGGDTTAQGASFFLAQLVYQLRWFAGLDDDRSREALSTLKGYWVEIRTAISRELIAAQERGEIRVRAEFAQIVDQFLLATAREFLLVSTNWDLVVDKSINDLPAIKDVPGTWHIFPLHVHGSVKDPATLYLPTEITREPYRQAHEDNAIGTIHGNIMRALEQSDRSVVYGLSMSPLDAELCMTVAAGWDNPVLREVVIIDPDHEAIAERVMLMLQRRYQVTVVGYHPGNLNDPMVYHRATTD